MYTDYPEKNKTFLAIEFFKIVEKDAPLKKKLVQRNQANFMNKLLINSMTIYSMSGLRNKFCKTLSKEAKVFIKTKKQMRIFQEIMQTRKG